MAVSIKEREREKERDGAREGERYEVRERKRRGRLEEGRGGSSELSWEVADFNGAKCRTLSGEKERRRELSSLFL